MGTDIIKEPSVVGDHQKRPGITLPPVLQMLCQPADSRHIKMVRGLVEEEDIPIPEQQPGQVHAPALPARQAADPAVKPDTAEQRFNYFPGMLPGRPFILFLPAKRSLLHSIVIIQAVILFKYPQRKPVPRRNTSRIRLLRSRKQMENRGFAVTVAPHDPDTVALVNAYSHIVTYIFCSV